MDKQIILPRLAVKLDLSPAIRPRYLSAQEPDFIEQNQIEPGRVALVILGRQNLASTPARNDAPGAGDFLNVRPRSPDASAVSCASLISSAAFSLVTETMADLNPGRRRGPPSAR